MASLSSNAASSVVDASPGRITPVLLAQEWKERIHNTGECIDVRNGAVHSMKACTSTKSRKWTNTIRTETASIEMNLTTQKMNNYVMRATAPFHLISYGSGANTMYHGRWKYVKRGTLPPNSYRKARYTFELAYVDDGNASSMIQKEENRRSSYEREWASAFENLLLHAAAYEPATFANIYDTEQGTIREYTPDFFLHEISCWIEIKGRRVTPAELHKCAQLSCRGFRIALLSGYPTDFTAYIWDMGKDTHSQDVYTSANTWWNRMLTHAAPGVHAETADWYQNMLSLMVSPPSRMVGGHPALQRQLTEVLNPILSSTPDTTTTPSTNNKKRKLSSQEEGGDIGIDTSPSDVTFY
jgi:hypothetical protein